MEFGRRQELAHQNMQEVLKLIPKMDTSLYKFRHSYMN
jgi:hypothetical protein